MAAPFVLTGRTVVVRLSEVPVDLRKQAAEKAAVHWGLTGVAFLELMIAAEHPRNDVELEVDEAKAARIRAGRFPPGPFPVFEDPTRRRRRA